MSFTRLSTLGLCMLVVASTTATAIAQGAPPARSYSRFRLAISGRAVTQLLDTSRAMSRLASGRQSVDIKVARDEGEPWNLRAVFDVSDRVGQGGPDPIPLPDSLAFKIGTDGVLEISNWDKSGADLLSLAVAGLLRQAHDDEAFNSVAVSTPWSKIPGLHQPGGLIHVNETQMESSAPDKAMTRISGTVWIINVRSIKEGSKQEKTRRQVRSLALQTGAAPPGPL